MIFVHPLQAKASEMENGFGSPESEDEIEKLEEQALSLRMVKLSAIFISFIFYQNFTTFVQFLVSISVTVTYIALSLIHISCIKCSFLPLCSVSVFIIIA